MLTASLRRFFFIYIYIYIYNLSLTLVFCVRPQKHYEDKSIPLDKRYDFPNCHIISTEFSRHVVSKFLMPKTKEGQRPQWSNALTLGQHVKFMTLMREPFARLLSQYRHDRFYTPRRFRDCPDLVSLVTHGSKCIQNGEMMMMMMIMLIMM
jgi:hypothetical protein